MHRHAAIVLGLVCSKFNHLTNELQPGSLTLEDFRKEPNTLVSDHLNQMMSKQFNAPMVHNQFHLLAYVPNQTMTAADLINATRCQSLWISNFKRTLANMTISKILANWMEQTLHHSTKDTRMNPSYHPALDNGFSIYYQEACTTKSYKKKIQFHKGRDQIPYGYPLCLTGEVWDAYINNPFDLSTRKEFLSKISLSCID